MVAWRLAGASLARPRDGVPLAREGRTTAGDARQQQDTAEGRLYASWSYLRQNGIASVALIVSLLGVLVSLLGVLLPQWAEAHPPEVRLLMPTQVRVSEFRQDSGEYRSVVYLQPAFTGTGNNRKIETINEMTLDAEPLGGGEEVSYVARSFGKFTRGPEVPFRYEYASDATALTVAPNEGRVVVVSFQLAANRRPQPVFEEGVRYLLRFTAQRNGRWSEWASRFRDPPPRPFERCLVTREARPDEVERIRIRDAGGLVPLSVEAVPCP